MLFPAIGPPRPRRRTAPAPCRRPRTRRCVERRTVRAQPVRRARGERSIARERAGHAPAGPDDSLTGSGRRRAGRGAATRRRGSRRRSKRARLRTMDALGHSSDSGGPRARRFGRPVSVGPFRSAMPRCGARRRHGPVLGIRRSPQQPGSGRGTMRAAPRARAAASRAEWEATASGFPKRGERGIQCDSRHRMQHGPWLDMPTWTTAATSLSRC